MLQRTGLCLAFALAAPAAAAFDANDVALGAPEQRVTERFPSAYCKPLEWRSRAAERRCDDGRISFGGVESRITFYLKAGAVEAFEVRFPVDQADKVAEFLKARYGKPASEGIEKFQRKGKEPREVRKIRWQNGAERAVFTARAEKSRASLSVWRGDFETEIYRVR